MAYVSVGGNLDDRMPCSEIDLVIGGLKLVEFLVSIEQEMEENLQMAEKMGLKPRIRTLPIDEIQKAIDLVLNLTAQG